MNNHDLIVGSIVPLDIKFAVVNNDTDIKSILMRLEEIERRVQKLYELVNQ